MFAKVRLELWIERRNATLLSRRLRTLETRLGVRLLERTTRRVALTQAGSLCLARAAAIVRAMEEGDQEVAGFAAEEPRGHLRLALPGSFGRLWLMPVIVDFLAAHPKVTIEAEFSNRLVDLIGERFDMAIRLGMPETSRLVVRKIGQRRLHTAVDADPHPPPSRNVQEVLAGPLESQRLVPFAIKVHNVRQELRHYMVAHEAFDGIRRAATASCSS